MKRNRNPIVLSETEARAMYARIGLDYETGLRIEDAAWLAEYPAALLADQQLDDAETMATRESDRPGR